MKDEMHFPFEHSSCCLPNIEGAIPVGPTVCKDHQKFTLDSGSPLAYQTYVSLLKQSLVVAHRAPCPFIT